jgi:hypothetical protein
VENGRTFAPAMESAKNYTRWVLRQFEGNFGRNVLEVGIGHGGYGDHVPAAASYCGLDIDPQNVAEARERYPSRSYDDRRAVRNMLRVLVPGGRLLLLVPALPSLFNDLDRIAGHRRRYTKRTLSGAIDRTLGRIERLAYFNSLGALGRIVLRRFHRGSEGPPVLHRGNAHVAADGLVARSFGQSLVAVVEKL